MKLNFKNFIAFSALVTFALVLISGIAVYLSPADSEALQIKWRLFSLPKSVWKAQFVISSFLFIIFTLWFILKVNWKKVFAHLQEDIPGKIQNSKELWLALAIPFIIFIITALEPAAIMSIARMDKQENSAIVEAEVQESRPTGASPAATSAANKRTKAGDRKSNSLIAIGDLTVTLLADNYSSLTPEKALKKLQNNDIEVNSIDATLYEISDVNNMALNEIYRIVASDEEVNPEIRNGKPVSLRTVYEISRELGISVDDIFKFFDGEQLSYTGDQSETLKEIADKGDRQSLDLYSGISGKKMTRASANQSMSQNTANQSSSLTIAQLVELVKRQQPNSDVNKERIITRLNQNQIKIKNTNATLGAIASENNISVDKLLQIISTGNSEKPKADQNLSTKKIEEPVAQKKDISNEKSKRKELLNSTIKALAEKSNIKTSELLQALKDNGIEAKPNDTVDQISKKNNKRPAEIFKILRSARKK